MNSVCLSDLRKHEQKTHFPLPPLSAPILSYSRKVQVYEELSTKSDLEVQQYIIVNDTKVNSLLVTNVPVCDVL
jgi:hypothetical protein